MHNKREKRAQVAIFVIVGIALVSAIIVFLFTRFKPELKPISPTENPSAFLEKCMSDAAAEAVGMLSMQGGTLNPTGYVLYNDDKIAYLCYTSSYYVGCVNQKPMLKYSVEREITAHVKPKLQQCISEMKSKYEQKGFSVGLGEIDLQTTLQPKKVIIDLKMPLTLSKEDTRRYEKFEAIVLHPLYEQVMLAGEIANSEAKYGDYDQLSRMLYNPQTSIDKKSAGESIVYIIKDNPSGKMFQFAVRSYVMPPGL